MAVIVVPWWHKVVSRASTKCHIAAVAVLGFSKEITQFFYDVLPRVWEHVPPGLRDQLPHYAPEAMAGTIVVCGIVVSALTTDKALDQARSIGATPEPIQPPPPPPMP